MTGGRHRARPADLSLRIRAAYVRGIIFPQIDTFSREEKLARACT